MKKIRLISAFLAAVIVFGAIGAGNIAEAAAPVAHNSRLVYNPDTVQFLHVFIDDTNGSLIGELLDDQGNRSGATHTYPVGTMPSLDEPFDVGYDPGQNKFLLVYETDSANETDLMGAWLDSDGAFIAGSEFVIYDEPGLSAGAPELAHDNGDKFAVAFRADDGVNVSKIGVALIAAGTLADLQIVESSSLLGEPDIVYEQSSGQFLVAWTVTQTGTFGNYVSWSGQIPQTLTFHKEPGARSLGQADKYHLRMAYDDANGRTALLHSGVNGSDEELTVTTVTYNNPQPIGSVIIDTAPYGPFVDYDIAYDSTQKRYAVVWQKSLTGEIFTGYLGGAYLNPDLSMQEKYPFLAWSANYNLYPTLAANPAQDNVLLAYAEDIGYWEGVFVSQFGWERQTSILGPRMSHNPSSGISLIIANVFDWNSFNSGNQTYQTVVRVSDGGTMNTVYQLNSSLDEDRIFFHEIDCCDGTGRYLAVWNEMNGSVPIVKGQMFGASGQLYGGIFDIAQNAEWPTVKLDPASGKFAVAYYDSNSGQLMARLVGDSSDIGAAMTIADISAADYPVQISLAYDSGMEAMLAVWNETVYNGVTDVTTIYGRYFQPGSLNLLGQNPLTIAESEGWIEQLKVVGGADGNMMHIAWSHEDNWLFFLNHAVLENGQTGPSQPHTSVQLGSAAFDLVYDPITRRVAVVWTEKVNDDQNAIVLQDLNELLAGSANPETVGYAPALLGMEFSEVSAAYNSASRVASIFASFSYFDITYDFKIIEAIVYDIESELHGLDGNTANAVSISDVIKYMQMNPLLDRTTIPQLLDLIDPVYEPLTS